MTWVISDYTATPGTNEVSVTNRQQVEIIDTNCKGAPDFCLVRINGNAADGSGTLEGLLPVSILKPAPSNKNAHRRTTTTANDANADPSDNNGKFIVQYFYCSATAPSALPSATIFIIATQVLSQPNSPHTADT